MSDGDLLARIDDAGVDHVMLEFPDLNGISRSQQVSVDFFRESWESGFTIPTAILSCTPQTVPAADSRYGAAMNFADGRLHPDPSTFTVVPWLESTGRVLCDFSHDGEAVPEYPRELLRRVVDDIATDHPELSFGVGSELEFYVFDVTEEGDYEPATDHRHEDVTWASEAVHGFHRALVEHADAWDVPLDFLQHEFGPGQLEILFRHGDPVAQGDLAFDFKRLVRATARQHGRRATFMAKPLADESGSGYHLHVSCTRDGENAFAADHGSSAGTGISETGRHFVGGLLEHADALVALQTATLNGYKRFEPGGFVPSTASWGYDNRMAGVRIPEGEPRVELRVGGADANPYVVIASTLAAGIDGVERRLDPGEPVSDRDPAGERPDLPRTPELALRALEDDDALVDRLGEAFVSEFVAVKRQGLAEFRDVVTDWEREWYVEMF